MKNFVEKNFEDVEIRAEQYPLSKERTILSYLVTGIQFLIFGILALGLKIKPYLPMISNEAFQSFLDNRMAIGMFVFFLGNILQNQITNSGALEVYLDGDLIWSKLQTGKPIDMQFLIRILRKRD